MTNSWRIRAMDKNLLETLKYLRLGGLLAHWDEYMSQAEKGRFSPVRLLQHVLVEEAKLKRENATKQRLKRAQIPEPWVLETFPFERQPKLQKKRILSLYDAFDFRVLSTICGRLRRVGTLPSTDCALRRLVVSRVI